MHSEKTKRKETGMLFILLIIIALYVITRFTYSIAPENFKLSAEIGNILIVCYLIWFLIRYKITDYIYTINKQTLFIDKQIGKRRTNVLKIETKDIVYIKNMKEIEDCKYNLKKKYNYGPNFFKKNKYFAVYKQKDNYYAFSFHSSEKLIKLLNS